MNFKFSATFKMDITQYLDPQSPCALILYPVGINVGRAAAILANRIRFAVTPTYVVTWDFENAYKSLEAVGAQDNLKIVCYEKLNDLDHLANGLVVFDDLRTVCNLLQLHNSFGIESIQNLLQRRNTVMILCTQGVRAVDVVQFSKVIPEARIWNSTFMDLGHNITYKAHLSKMTPRQDFLYHLRSQQEVSQNFVIEAEAHRTSQEICNIAFPEQIQNYLDAPASSNLPPLTPTQIVSNLGFVEIYSNAPKIEKLILCLMSHSNERHVIFTRYNGVYGLGLLEALINQINRNPEITPKLQIVTIGRQMVEAEKLEQLKLFNADCNAPYILVTDRMLDENAVLMNVNHFHLLDGALKVGLQMSRVMYKYQNYPGKPMPPALTVHNHVCLRADVLSVAGAVVSGGASIDLIYYNQLCEQLRTEIEYWERLVKASPSLIALKDRLTLGI